MSVVERRRLAGPQHDEMVHLVEVRHVAQPSIRCGNLVDERDVGYAATAHAIACFEDVGRRHDHGTE
jgi:hypothetical protein